MVSRNVSTARLFGFFSDGAKPCVRPDVSAVLLSESSRRETVLLLKRTDLHIASVFSLSRHKTERLPEIDKDRVGCSIPALFLMWRRKSNHLHDRIKVCDAEGPSSETERTYSEIGK